MSRVAGVGPEPVEPLLVYAAQQLVEPVGHARPIVERVAQTVEGAGDGLCLLCIDQLRDCREVYGVAAIAYCRPPECLGRSVILGWSKGHARGLSCLQRVEHGFLGLGHLRANERARLLRDVARDVAIDGDNEVRMVEIWPQIRSPVNRGISPFASSSTIMLSNGNLI